ncbi:hypothetical protein AJ80_03158 [Polytolypa hystricis UAMH7299]|uniref:Uncharacterized protein n=1 Tax=Polytolypa hystricis (strain UAMH7299) TaxID=1447883 RepID=A0A2B7YJX9_POLH7|nr:hypothetical protein AJ80_03158 [Polytolypa hystricis UAMH7299]
MGLKGKLKRWWLQHPSTATHRDSTKTAAAAVGTTTTTTTTVDSDAKSIPASTTVNEQEPAVEEDFGLFTLYEPPGPPRVDIVAVHGLNGHYARTWTQGQSNWLQDFLPRDIPDARILALGYDSRVVFSSSVGNIDRFADQLLAYLSRQRRTQAEHDRPLIFVCHSLGGLVVKQAIIRAHETPNYVHILEHLYGIIFLATPHRGSKKWGSVGAIAAGTLKALSLGFSTNDRLVKDLKNGSAKLEQIGRSFIHRTENFRIVSFFELQCLGSMPWPVVPEDSATLGIPGEIRIPIDANHRTICRFRFRDEQNYQSLVAVIQDLAEGATEADTKRRADQRQELQLAFSEQDQEYCQALYTSNYAQHRSRVARPVGGTCTWILKHMKYHRWITSKSSSVLCLSAYPGCGKTVLSSFLIDSISQSQERTTVCYFFLRSDNPEQKSMTSALSAILHQLLRKRPALLRHVIAIANYHGKKVLQQFNMLWNILVASALDDLAGDIICIIDGLDECSDTEWRAFVEVLADFFHTEEADRSNLKFILSSRPYPAIEQELSKVPGIEYFRIRAEEEPIHLKRDIELLIKARVKELATVKSLPEAAEEELVEHLTTNAGSNFLWVTLVLDLIEQSARVSWKAIAKILETTPEKLDELYDQILSRSTDPVEAKRLLHILVAAKRPLTLDEVNVALNISEEDISIDDVALEPSIAQTVKALCGLFLEIVDNRVYFVHETAWTFLINLDNSEEHTTQSSLWKGSLNLDTADAILGTSCICYLSLSGFEAHEALNTLVKHERATSIEDDSRSGTDDSYDTGEGFEIHTHGHRSSCTIRSSLKSLCRRYKFLSYATQYWPAHFSFGYSAQSDTVKKRAIQLCDPQLSQFLLWALFPRKALTFNGLKFLHWQSDRNRSGSPDPLAVMVSLGSEALVRHYLTTGAPNLNVRFPRTHESLLHISILGQHTGISLCLIHAGIKLELRDYLGYTPLHLACSSGELVVVQSLIERGVSVHRRTKNDITPLSEAVEFYKRCPEGCDYHIVELLLDASADPSCCDHSSRPLLVSAVESNMPGLVRTLLAHGARVRNPERGAEPVRYYYIHLAISATRSDKQLEAAVEIIELLLLHEATVNEIDDHGMTPLYTCFADFDRRWNAERDDPYIMIESFRICWRLTALLLQNGADPNITAPFCDPILHLLVRSRIDSPWLDRLDKLFDVLVDHGADINMRNTGGESLLGYTIHQQMGELGRRLLALGADVNNPDSHGPALLRAVHIFPDGDALVKDILAHGADPNLSHDDLGSPLITAAARSKVETARLLIYHGADPNLSHDDLGSPLITAAARGKVETARLLIYHGADVNLDVGGSHGTALIAAAKHSKEHMVRVLLANFADPKGCSVLNGGKVVWAYRIAAKLGHREVMSTLMWNGATLDPEDEWEFTNDFKDAEVEEVTEQDTNNIENNFNQQSNRGKITVLMTTENISLQNFELEIEDIS